MCQCFLKRHGGRGGQHPPPRSGYPEKRGRGPQRGRGPWPKTVKYKVFQQQKIRLRWEKAPRVSPTGVDPPLRGGGSGSKDAGGGKDVRRPTPGKSRMGGLSHLTDGDVIHPRWRDGDPSVMQLQKNNIWEVYNSLANKTPDNTRMGPT